MRSKVVNFVRNYLNNMNFIEVEGFDDYAKKEDNIEDLRSSAIVVYNRLLWLQDLFHELFE